MPDHEIPESARVGRLDQLNAFDKSTARPLPTPVKHFLDLFIRTFKDGLHAAVREIADPPAETETGGLPVRPCPEEDTLNKSGDVNVNPFHVKIGTRLRAK